MNLFHLPKSTVIDRLIPKNAFDLHTNPKQKKLISETIEKIRWSHKLSSDTLNLPSNLISEIQIFEVSIRTRTQIAEVLELIDKSIPYHIVFLIFDGNEYMISTSKKHVNPTNEDRSVIDWTFNTNWISIDDFYQKFNLTNSIDEVYTQFCTQLSELTPSPEKQTIEEVISLSQEQKKLLNKIHQLESQISKEKQFNKKLELNIQLQKLKNLMG